MDRGLETSSKYLLILIRKNYGILIIKCVFCYICCAGEVLRGDRIVNTLYNVEMNKDSKCEMVCNKKKLSIEESKLVAERIQEEYYVHL